jgi:hypothetical protein
MVRKSLLKKVVFPFATVSTATLMFTFKTAKAATLSDIILQKRGALTHNYSGGSNGISLLDVPKQVIHNIDVITSKIIDALDWLNNLPFSIPKYTADLLTAIFHFLSKITLQVPLFIFNNPYIKNTSMTFALISITLVTIFTVFESIMQMLNKQHTDFKTIAKRWLVVASISGFMPFAFETGFTYLNKLSDAISHIGINQGTNHGFISGESIGWFNTLVIILFDVTAISMLIPICLQAGRKWFDLLCLCAISPLALSSWCFKRHEHYFKKWWEEVKLLSLSQIIYAVYILLMGIILFTFGGVHGGIFTLITKTILIIAALNKLTHPPQFVKRMTDSGGDIFDEYDKTKNTFKDIYKTITLQNFRPVQFLKKKALEKKKAIQSLRKKHKRRIVGDLL